VTAIEVIGERKAGVLATYTSSDNPGINITDIRVMLISLDHDSLCIRMAVVA